MGAKQGHDSIHAFKEWKNIYVYLQTMTYSVLAGCWIRYFNLPTLEDIQDIKYLSLSVLALIVGATAVYQIWEGFKELGKFAMFYGDFFVESFQNEEQISKQI